MLFFDSLDPQLSPESLADPFSAAFFFDSSEDRHEDEQMINPASEI